MKIQKRKAWNKNKKLYYPIWNKDKKGLQTAWNKDLTHNTDNRVKCNKHSKKTKLKMSKIAKQNGTGLWNKGKKQTDEWKEKRITKIRGDKFYNWKGGLTKQQKDEKTAGRKRSKKCEICKKEGKICFDHDHSTGKFRGWICQKCNLVLGLVHDDKKLLKQMLNYLKDK